MRPIDPGTDRQILGHTWQELYYMINICHIIKRVIGSSGSLIWSKTFMELIFNSCGEFR